MIRALRDGAAIGLSLTAALVSVSAAGWKAAGLPFIAFDLFDWLASLLPGAVVTFGLDAVVSATSAAHVSIGLAAKTAEQAMAIALLLFAGAIAGALLSAVLLASDEPPALLGVIVGALMGAAAVVIERSTMRIEAGAFLAEAWVCGLFLAWGVVFARVYERYRARPETPSAARRSFLLRVAGVATATTIAGSAAAVAAGLRRIQPPGALWSDLHDLPNSASPVQPVPGTRSELTPIRAHYRVDIDTSPPSIDETSWRLAVDGLVRQPFSRTLADLRARPAVHQFITLSCISNPIGGDLIGTTRWSGVSLHDLLPEFGLEPRATHLRISSRDGFHETVALDTIQQDRRVMLAYAWDGVRLSAEHGFPIRLYIPAVYGMKQPKWIDRIEAIAAWEPGYWVARGWDRTGRMQATSTIDAVRVQGLTAAIGGIAHAGARGISRVEIRVDDGPWREARIRDPLSPTTWVVWRCELSMGPGPHTLAVRCYDAAGIAQPDGTLYKRRVTL